MKFMATSPSKLVDNIMERIHKSRCKDCSCVLEYESAKNSLIKYRCLSSNKDYSSKINEKLKKKLRIP